MEVAKAAEAGGASAVAVHGRTREQYYAGKADWDIIARVKGAVKIPVIGNGDLTCPEDVEAMAAQTGCDGFMIGRAAQGNPWIFRQILSYFETGEHLPKPFLEEMIPMMLRHARMEIEYKGETTAMREMRRHAAWYTAGYRNSSKLRGRIQEVCSYRELEELFEKLLDKTE